MNTKKQLSLLHRLIAEAKQNGRGEHECLEFKTNIGECHSSITFEGVGEYISAMANAACLQDKETAYLVLGVQDNTWEIVGTNLRMATQKYKGQEFEFWLRLKLRPKNNFQILEFDTPEQKHIVIFAIPSAKGEPIVFNAKKHIRIGSNNTNLEEYPEYLRKIYNSQTDWSAKIVNEASLKDLEPEALKLAKEKFKENSRNKSYYKEIDQWSDEKWLDVARLTINGAITNAAILLLGKEESTHYISPAVAQLTWKLDGEELVYEHFTPPFFLNATRLYQKIRNYKYKFFPSDELLATSVDKYSSEVVLEGLNNAIAHQDYGMCARITVIEKNDSLEITNAGKFFYGKPEDYFTAGQTPTKYRNRFLADAMVNIGMIDTAGYGIYKMVSEQKKRFFPLPDYLKSGTDNVVLTIYGKELNMNYCKLLMEQEISLHDAILLDRLQKGCSITKEQAQQLRKKQYIEGRYPNLFISATIARKTNDVASYIRIKGVDKDFIKNQIMKFLQIKNGIRADEIEAGLADKLSSQKTEKQKKDFIRNMLQQMKREGNIICKGKYWYLTPA